MIRHLFFLSASISLFFSFACAPDDGSSSSFRATYLRFIEDAPDAVLDPDAFTALTAEELPEVLGRPWLVELGSEVRSSLLGYPGLPIDRRVVVPPDASFRFSYAVPTAERRDVTFLVSLGPDENSLETLFEGSVDAENLEDGPWHEVELDLSRHAGREVLLRLEIRAPNPFVLGEGLPVWGNPELLHAAEKIPPSIIFVSLDTLRADHLSLYGYPRATSPNLDRWAQRNAVVFRNAVAPSPWTLPSHVSMFTGLEAHRHGVNYIGMSAPPALTMLAESLRQAGYKTLAITGGGMMHPKSGLAQGFDLYRTRGELEEAIAGGLELLRANQRRPFFLFFHTYEVHEPYHPRQPYFDAFGGLTDEYLVRIRQRPGLDDAKKLHQNHFVIYRPGSTDEKPLPAELEGLPTDLYDSGIAYTDGQLELLFRELEQLDLESRAAVVLTSDHGEMLGEHDLAGHAFLYDENLMVPLVMSFPDRRGAGRVLDEQVRSIDVMPTLLEIADVAPASNLDGSSLLPLVDRGAGPDDAPRAAWSYAASGTHGLSLRVSNRVKFILRNNVVPPLYAMEELYDLRQDPREAVNLAATAPEAERLRTQAERVLEERTAGVRVRFSNAGSSPIEGTLHGEGITHSIKAVDLPCRCIHWVDKDTARFQVPPATAFTVSIENLQSPMLQVDLLSTGDGRQPPFQDRFSFAIDALEEPARLAFDGSRWRQVEASAGGDFPTAIRIWWQGESGIHSPQPVEMDPELRKELQALGYLQ